MRIAHHILVVIFLLWGPHHHHHCSALAWPWPKYDTRDSIVDDRSRDKTAVCLSESCVLASSFLLRQMDTTVDPCKDFYQFACGGFIDKYKNNIPEHKDMMSSIDLRDQLNQDLLKVFESKPLATEPKIYQGVRNMYTSCMNSGKVQKDSLEDLKEIVSRLGGWPVVEGDSWRGEQGFRWWKMSMRAAKEGLVTWQMNGAFTIGFQLDPLNTKRKVLTLDELWLGLSRDYLVKGLQDRDVQDYYNQMVSMAVLLGAEEDTAKQEMEEALKVEIQMAELMLSQEDTLNITDLYRTMALKEVQKLYPNLPLLDYINGLMLNQPVNITEDEMIIVADPKYVLQVRELLAKVPARVQANYIVWRIVQGSMWLLNTVNVDYELDYDINRHQSHWCIENVKYDLSLAVASMYVKMFHHKEAKNKATEMAANIRSELMNVLDDIDWLDAETKSQALLKAEKMSLHIGYPKELLDDNLITQHYQDLNLDTGSYLKNLYRLQKFKYQQGIKEFRENITKNNWKTHAEVATIDAFYDFYDNSINIPAAIMRHNPLVHPNLPAYLNYGALGSIIGHEITHGFDDEGSKFDDEGKLDDWWGPETIIEYLEKAQCIIDQYGNYSLDVGEGEMMNLDGVNTQAENTADNGGLKLALGAYLNLGEEESSLPALPYTARQLFWLSAASRQCAVYMPDTLKNLVLNGRYSASSFSVNGPMSNMPEFSEDWGCPLGSPMNPVKKCSVW